MILAGAKKAQDKDALGLWTIKDATAPIGTAPDAVALISRHQREALGKIGEATGYLAQLLHEADRACGIVRFDMLGDAIEIGQRIRRQDEGIAWKVR
jgi:hypothetical protein